MPWPPPAPCPSSVGAKELGIPSTDAFGASLRGHPAGWVQLYIREPAGNLVEVDWPDASTLDPAILAEMTPLENGPPEG